MEAGASSVAGARGESWGSSVGSSFSWNGESSQVGFTSSSNRGGQEGTSWSRSRGGGWNESTSQGQSSSAGGGWSEQMDYVLQPSFFANGLRQGGERNNYLVDAILVQANRVFSRTGNCWTPLTYSQR